MYKTPGVLIAPGCEEWISDKMFALKKIAEKILQS
jgi:hypothetical protein